MNFDIKEFFPIIDNLAKEKNIPADKITKIVEAGIALALEREIINNSKFYDFAKSLENFIEVILDRDTKEVSIYRKHFIVSPEECTCPEFQVTLSQIKSIELQIAQQERALKSLPEKQRSHYIINAEEGYLSKKIDCLFSRQQFNAAKQYIKDKINREFSIIKIESLLEKGNFFEGKISDIKKDFYMVSLDNIEIKIPKPYVANNEIFELGDSIDFSIIKGNEEKKGTLFYDNKNHHCYLGTRNSVVYLENVLKNTIFANTDTEIIYSIRQNGYNKVIINNNLPDNSKLPKELNLISKNFLNKEKIDIITYNNDPIQLIIRLVSPTQILRILKEDTKINLIFQPHDISKLILKNEQDILNIENIIKYQLGFYSTEEWKRKENMEKDLSSYIFKRYLNIKDYIIKHFNSNEIVSLEGIADVPETAFLSLTKSILSREKALNIHNTAINIMEQKNHEIKSIYELSKLGLSTEEIEKLQAEKIYTLEDVAELAFFELEEILPNINENFGKKMIMKARCKTNLIDDNEE